MASMWCSRSLARELRPRKALPFLRHSSTATTSSTPVPPTPTDSPAASSPPADPTISPPAPAGPRPPRQPPQFPPTEARRALPASSAYSTTTTTAADSSSAPSVFSASLWASQQRAPAHALAAFAARLSLKPIRPALIEQACTHPSFLTKSEGKANGALALLGNDLLGQAASEFVHLKWPHLPLNTIKAAVSALVGPKTCAAVAREWGGASVLRWQREPRTPDAPVQDRTLHEDAMASLARGIVGLVYQEKGLPAALSFIQTFFLSRSLDLRLLLKFEDPIKVLAATTRKFGREPVVSRLMKETGRYSMSPVFVVGVYSGTTKLGEGFGSSIKMAEHRAATNALHHLYLTSPYPTSTPTLPISTLFSSPTSSSSSKPAYQGPELGHAEVAYMSAGRSRKAVGGRGEKYWAGGAQKSEEGAVVEGV